MPTAQETFNKVVRHLRKQGCKSVLQGGLQCQYRGEGGLRCAVGVLIPDKLYHPFMEMRNVTDYPVRAVMCDLGYGEHFVLLSALQGLHDSTPAADWEAKFLFLASHYNLTVPPLDVPEPVELRDNTAAAPAGEECKPTEVAV